MRSQLLKLTRRNSTKGERRIGEILKRNKIPFKVKQMIGGREADIVVGRLIIEVDGNIHFQTDSEKDTLFFSLGYVPIHISTHSRNLPVIERDLLYLIKANNHGR